MGRRVHWLRPAGAVVGLVAEWVAFDWSDARFWVPDLLTGWVVISCGLFAWTRRPDSRVGVLLTAVGFTWFVGNFAAVGGVLGWVAAHAVFLHRGVLVHLLLAYPMGRLPSRFDRIAVAGGYLAALVPQVWRSEVATIGLAGLLVAACGLSYLRAQGRFRRARLTALQAAVGLGMVLAGGAVTRLAVPSGAANYPSLLAYQVALCAVAVGLLAGLLAASWERSAVTDLVVELGDSGGSTLAGALAWALDDPALRVGFCLPSADGFVDANGEPVVSPDPSTGRTMTVVEHGGRPVAAVLHDAAVLDDPGLLDAVSSAAGLAAANARLRAEVDRQVAEVRASRRRLLQADDDEGRRLERRLHDGAGRRLAELAEVLDRARQAARSETVRTGIVRIGTELGATIGELRQLAQGMHPSVLAERGLAAALDALADHAPIPVDVDVTGGRLPSHLEATVYFVCSEALANIAKHASAAKARVAVRVRDGRIHVEISDDGVGGADMAGGSGLRGLADRVEALGGQLHVQSVAGRGTRLSADIPAGVDVATPASS